MHRHILKAYSRTVGRAGEISFCTLNLTRKLWNARMPNFFSRLHYLLVTVTTLALRTWTNNRVQKCCIVFLHENSMVASWHKQNWLWQQTRAGPTLGARGYFFRLEEENYSAKPWLRGSKRRPALSPGKPRYFLCQSELLFPVGWEIRLFVSQSQLLFHLKNQSTMMTGKRISRQLWQEARLSPSILVLQAGYLFFQRASGARVSRTGP